MKMMGTHKIGFPDIGDKGINHQGLAWLGLSLTLGIHVLDEALTNFLSVYNPTVQALRERFPFLPLPTFTFAVWITGLSFAVGVLLLLSLYAFRRTRWIRLASYPFAILMIGNGLVHITGSFYLERLMPGVTSAPLLIASSIYLLWAVRQEKPSRLGKTNRN